MTGLYHTQQNSQESIMTCTVTTTLASSFLNKTIPNLAIYFNCVLHSDQNNDRLSHVPIWCLLKGSIDIKVALVSSGPLWDSLALY